MELNYWTVGNPYIKYIINPTKGFFKRFLFKFKLKRKLKKLAPSRHQMTLIAECLYFLDMIYLFENDAKINGISGIVKPKRAEYAITIMPNATQIITITLSYPKTITIEIHNGGKLRSKISFEDGRAEVNDKYDELLFIHINDFLMDAFTKVLLKYI